MLPITVDVPHQQLHVTDVFARLEKAFGTGELTFK